MSENTITITEDNFADEVENSDVPVLVDVWGDGCGPCKMIEPLIDQVAGEYTGKAKVGKLNIGQNMALAAKFGITSVPTLMFFKGGDEDKDKRVIGAGGNVKAQITEKLDALV